MKPSTTQRCVCDPLPSPRWSVVLYREVTQVIVRPGGELRGVVDELVGCPCGAVSPVDVAGVVRAPTYAGRPVGLG